MKTNSAKVVSDKEKLAVAESRSAHWLIMARDAEEKGENARAERYFRKSEWWLVRANSILETRTI